VTGIKFKWVDVCARDLGWLLWASLTFLFTSQIIPFFTDHQEISWRNSNVMSRIRGVVPLFLVTTIGIANGKSMTVRYAIKLIRHSGLWVFGPAFKEEQKRKQQAKYRQNDL
jgi:hypothetical protein